MGKSIYEMITDRIINELENGVIPWQKYKGKPPMQIDERLFRSTCKRWRSGEITATQAMKELKLKPNTFYRRVKQLNL